MEDLVRTARALGDESRIRILAALGHGELCVCQLIELLGLAPSTVSKHLSILKDAGLVQSRKEGRWIHYRLAAANAGAASSRALGWAIESVAESDRAVADLARLEEILKIDPEALCSRQARRTVSEREKVK